MPIYTDIGYTTGSFTNQEAVIADNVAVSSLYCATYRQMEPGASSGIYPTKDSSRNSSVTYAKGYRETIRCSVNSGLPWQWRRVVFCIKNKDLLITGPSGAQNTFIFASNGYNRVFNNQTGAATQNIWNVIFEGTQGNDWVDPITAKTDRQLVTVLSDSITQITPQTNTAGLRTFKRYYPFEKSLTYYDDENGISENSSGWASPTNANMGDCFIYDYIRPAVYSTGSTAMRVFIEGTYYWHEK